MKSMHQARQVRFAVESYCEPVHCERSAAMAETYSADRWLRAASIAATMVSRSVTASRAAWSLRARTEATTTRTLVNVSRTAMPRSALARAVFIPPYSTHLVDRFRFTATAVTHTHTGIEARSLYIVVGHSSRS